MSAYWYLFILKKITIRSRNIDEVIIQTDTSYKPKPKTFYDNVKKRAAHDTGLCIIHKLDNKYYFEIPDSILDKDILIVNRISKAAAQVKPEHSYSGYGADQIGENVIRFLQGRQQ